jgi:hypothetical protein
MSPIVRWGLAVGLVLAGVDLVAAETSRGVSDQDLLVAIALMDQMINLALFGLAGFRVAAASGAWRPGLEAAVLGGLVTGSAAVVYDLVRGTEAPSAAHTIELLAWNIVLAASAGALAAWVGSARRLEPPPER